ncbi:MAG: sigma factor [Acidimicrobiales bacterium]
MVWSVVRSFRLPDDDAADAAQMAWLRALEHLGTVRDLERIGLWLATITRRECLRLIERRTRHDGGPRR